MQHLRFADGAQRNVLPLCDVWEHKRMLIADTQERGREEEERGARSERDEMMKESSFNFPPASVIHTPCPCQMAERADNSRCDPE